MKTKIILAATLLSLTASLAACNSDKSTETPANPRQDTVTQPQAGTRSPIQSDRQPTATSNPDNPDTTTPQSQTESGDRAASHSANPAPEQSAPAPQTLVEQPAGDRTKPEAAAKPAATEPEEQALNPAGPLPKLDNVKFGSVQYLSSEATPDAAIEQAINQAMPDAEGTRYYYNRIDLSGDGKPEALVYLVGSYTCGSGGCTMMVMEPQGQAYSVVSKMTLVNAPVLVASETTSGWNDLVIPVQGGGAEGHYARLQFDGSSYPRNPSIAPEVAPNATLNGTAIITDAADGGGGIQLARQ